MTALRAFLTTTLLLGLTFTGRSSFGQAPTGSITNQVFAATNALWDVSLLFPDLTPNAIWATNLSAFAARATNDAVQVGFSAPQILDGHGTLRGSGTNTFSLALLAMEESVTTNPVPTLVTNTDNSVTTNYTVVTNRFWGELTNYDALPGTYTVRGSVIGVKGAAIFQFLGKESGTLSLEGVAHQLTVLRGFYLMVSSSYLLSGTEASVIRLSGRPGYYEGSHFSPFNPFFSYGGGGSWTLVLNFDAPSGTATNKLSGSATATLSSGNVYPFQFTGRYSPKTGLSTLLLKGVPNTADTHDGRGCTLAVTVATNEVVKMLGRVAGQAISQK